MPLIATPVNNGKTVILEVQGRFDFNMHREFRSAYENVDRETQFVVDLSAAEYMDSSALGMLLLLRDYVGGDKSHVVIRNCNAEIRKVLTIANFHQLFTLE